MLGRHTNLLASSTSKLPLYLAARSSDWWKTRPHRPPAAMSTSSRVETVAVEPQRNAPCNATSPLAVQIPPPPDFFGLGSRVEHVLAKEQGLVSSIVSESLQLPQSFVHKLIEFGAVYTCPVPPTPPPEMEATLPAETVEEMRRVREAAAQAAGANEKERRNPKLRTPQRLGQDCLVAQHSYIRVHVHPKRFPAAYSVRWEDRIIADREEFVVVNKPPGVPVAPTVDNLLECCPAMAARAVGSPTPLLVTHRLDQATEGVVMLGKSTAFVARFNALLRSDARAVRKLYRALTAAPPPEGTLVHHLSVAKRQAGLPFHTIAHGAPAPDSARCELRVLGVSPVDLTGDAALRWGPSAFECLLELITGKTHQIRAQLSAAGCPLLGDDLYTPLASPELRQRLYSGDPSLQVLDADGQRLLKEPVGAIGLQACRLIVPAEACTGRESGGGDEVFEAGSPWWRAAPL